MTLYHYFHAVKNYEINLALALVTIFNQIDIRIMSILTSSRLLPFHLASNNLKILIEVHLMARPRNSAD